MAWSDRIKEAAYTAPSGVRYTFLYEDLEKKINKRTSGFEFSDANGTYVQENGNSGRVFPLKIIFSGPDYDQTADSFLDALLEKGNGKLEHPVYGNFTVVPFGEITRRDRLKTAANEAVFFVTFWETTGLIYPSQQQDPISEIGLTIDEFSGFAADEFAENQKIEKVTEEVDVRSKYQIALDAVSQGLGAIADTQEEISQEFNTILKSINRSIDILIKQPVDLVTQTLLLIQAPGRAITNVRARIDSYGNLIDNLTDTLFNPGDNNKSRNEFLNNEFFATGCLSGSLISVLNTDFQTKTDVFLAANSVSNQFDRIIGWREDNYRSLGIIDTGGSYQKIQDSVSLTLGFLVELSFDLRQENRIILDRKRTIIDLIPELYGDLNDELLNFVISSNNLSGSQILELDTEDEIVFYV